jgi:hypothetical protein
MSEPPRADCQRCRHFRSAPYEARLEGCYYPDFMVAKQKAAFLDEQQQPGDHRILNRDGDCKAFEPRPERPPLLRRLLGLGDQRAL